MLCVEDQIDALKWAESVGGLAGLVARSEGNLAAIAEWVKRAGWADFLARDKATRSCTSICLKFSDPAVAAEPAAVQAELAKKITSALAKEKAAYDIGFYRDAPPGLRIWGGATVETADIKALLPWLDWAFADAKVAAKAAA
jgi:phosphoserine aminotransferase